MKFHLREFNTLLSIISILEKGEVETQIAKHFHDSYWGEKDVIAFIKKLKLSPEWNSRIINAYKKYYTLPYRQDSATNLGGSLKRSAFYADRTPKKMTIG